MVLKVLHIIPAMIQGGAEKLLFDLVVRSRPAIDMNIVTLLAEAPFFKFDGDIVHDLGLKRGQLSRRAIMELRRKIREFKPHVIHAWLYAGNLFATAAVDLGIPIIWSIHNTTLSKAHSKRSTRLTNVVCARLSGRVPSRIVYCAASARDAHERIGYDRSRGVLIENGIDFDAFAFDAAARQRTREVIGLAVDDYAIGCVARFDPQKNHALLIEAFSKLRHDEHARLVLVGRGCTANNKELMHWLEISGVRDRTKLLGERGDIAAILSALDIWICASTYGEALSLAAIEAAAIGLPIVTTDVGEMRTFVLDPAHVVSPVSADAMAAAIRNARNSGAALETRKIERRMRIVCDFSLGTTVERYHALYRELAKAA